MVLFLLPGGQTRHQRWQRVSLLPSAASSPAAITDQRHFLPAFPGLQLDGDPRPEEALDLIHPVHPLFLLHSLFCFKVQHQRVLAVPRLFPHGDQNRTKPPRQPTLLSKPENPRQRLVQVLLVTIPKPCHVVAQLVLNIRGLRLAQGQGCRLREARNRSQLGIRQRKAQQRDGEPIDQEKRRHVTARQHLEEGAESVGQEAQPDRGQNRAEGNALDSEGLLANKSRRRRQIHCLGPADVFRRRRGSRDALARADCVARKRPWSPGLQPRRWLGGRGQSRSVVHFTG
mmetsp:Transcript_3199/g.9471  ORF Transcript_3199/g.9471 Transcript_3199/m.9471 type:complete len:286 (+) Transcript_3199:688-1545(+)